MFPGQDSLPPLSHSHPQAMSATKHSCGAEEPCGYLTLSCCTPVLFSPYSSRCEGRCVTHFPSLGNNTWPSSRIDVSRRKAGCSYEKTGLDYECILTSLL